jgi:hypothetical protein
MYQARSYPDADKDNDGTIELYNTPVYEVKISTGTNSRIWKAVRFMPYWNDPSSPNTHYRTRGFVNSGLHSFSKKAVSLYLPNYGTQNRYSPHHGAIQIRNNFLIHAGPSNLSEIGWGSAGCVEIIGDFGQFKKDIRDLAGINSSIEPGTAISRLVQHKKLFVEVQYDTPPDFMTQMVKP